jgi:cytochrome P450
MEYFVKRYAPACHSQLVTKEDEVMMQKIYDASLECVQVFKRKWADGSPRDATIERCMFGCFLNAGGYSDYEMAATMVNVMIAAGEAPASTLAQLLEEMGRDQEKQQRVLAEAEALTRDLAPVADQLEYALNCTVEGLRLFAPATLVQRQALVDTEVCGVAIPKGQVVGVCVHSVHNDPAQWPAPQTFNPDRPGLDYETSKSLCTFSKGPRGCPGKHNAVAICKLTLAMIVREFQLDVAPDTKPSQQMPKVPKMVEWSVHGIPLALTRRGTNLSLSTNAVSARR